MISKQEVKYIAKLARLGLTEDEIQKMEKDLSSILGYIDKLKNLDVKDIEPTSHSVLVENVMRIDKVKKENPERINRLIEESPGREGRYIRVKSIL